MRKSNSTRSARRIV